MTVHSTGRLLKTGSGWRLGWQPDADVFQGLVGGDDWALELTGAEMADFCRLTQQLVATMHQMTRELMDGERLNCELESPLIWLEVEGYPSAYSLRLMLMTGRRGEGFWPATALPGLLQALPTLQVF